MTRTTQRYIRHSPGSPWMFCQSKHQPFHVNASFLQPNSSRQTTMLVFHQPFSKNCKSWSLHGVTSLSTGLHWILRRLKTLRKSSCIFLLRMMRWGSGNRGRSTHEIILKIALLRSTMFGEISLILQSMNQKFFHCHEKACTHKYESQSAPLGTLAFSTTTCLRLDSTATSNTVTSLPPQHSHSVTTTTTSHLLCPKAEEDDDGNMCHCWHVCLYFFSLFFFQMTDLFFSFFLSHLDTFFLCQHWRGGGEYRRWWLGGG